MILQKQVLSVVSRPARLSSHVSRLHHQLCNILWVQEEPIDTPQQMGYAMRQRDLKEHHKEVLKCER